MSDDDRALRAAGERHRAAGNRAHRIGLGGLSNDRAPGRRHRKQLHAGGTIWRLRSLIAMGHDSTRIARAMNVRPETIRKLVRGDAATVSPEFRELARDLWNVWWDKRPPERTRSERCAASAARRRAERHGWPAAAALDEDELDEPGYKPFSRYRPAMGIGIAPDFRPARRLRNAREIA